MRMFNRLVTSFVGLLLTITIPCTSVAEMLPLAASDTNAANPSTTRFRSLYDQQRLPAEIITELTFDATGFLWIGTREGLFLYDGQHFRKFQHEVQNPDSISSNGVRGVFEDSRGRLWINTISGGLNLLDRATWTFRSWRHDRSDRNSLSHDGVFVLAEAPAAKLWVGTQAGLDLFDPTSGAFEHQILATGGEFVITLLTDSRGQLWVGTLGQGLFRRGPNDEHFEPVLGMDGHTPLDIFSLAEDAGGRIWVGARDGLYRFDADSARVVNAGLAPANAAELSNVTALQPTPDGGLWIGTFGIGLYRLDPNAHSLVAVALGPSGPGAQHIDEGALTLDRNGTLFVGTFGAGVFRASVRIAGLETWQARDDDQPGLRYQDVYALLPGSPLDSTTPGLLVGSFGGGIDKIVAKTRAVEPLQLPVPEEVSARVNGITDLLRTRNGVLWAATNEGVYQWNRQTGDFHYYEPDSPTGPSSNPGYSYALFADHEDRVWVGTGGGGLYLYQASTGTFRNFRPVAGARHSLSDDFVTALIEDEHGRLWVGTRSGGINICQLSTRLDCLHLATGTGPHNISHDHVTSLLRAADHSIWAGTAGGGLNRIMLDADGEVASVQHWTRNDGLADDNVMALVYAPDGALWMSTHGGLSRLDPDTGTLTNITTARGLPTAVFNPKAAMLYQNKLYFGSAKGVVALDPAQGPQAVTPPPTVIERILGLDASKQPSVPAWQVRALTLPWRQPFSLELAVLGFGASTPQFQYRLDPNEPWIDLGDQGRLTLHELAPGSYPLEIRGRRGGHAWTTAPPLKLDIVPPLWRRTWVQVGAASLLLALLFGGLILRMRELETRHRDLRHAHHQRKQALVEAHNNRDRLEDAFTMLRRMTMRLETAKEDERSHLARELHDEFGQALTSAKINLGLALTRSPSTDSEARITDTIHVIEGLIHQVRALSLDLRPPLLDELGLLPALEAYIHATSERAGIPIASRLAASVSMGGIEREIAVFRIVQEAVTNALRHANANKLEVIVESVADGVHVCIVDDGDGFDVESAITSGASGLGLFGMRERVHDLGGRWSLESRRGHGTVVNAFIPSTEISNPEIESRAHHSG